MERKIEFSIAESELRLVKRNTANVSSLARSLLAQMKISLRFKDFCHSVISQLNKLVLFLDAAAVTVSVPRGHGKTQRRKCRANQTRKRWGVTRSAAFKEITKEERRRMSDRWKRTHEIKKGKNVVRLKENYWLVHFSSSAIFTRCWRSSM